MTLPELRAALEATCPTMAQTGPDGVCKATICVPLKTLQLVREAAEKHLATLPKTKIVEVWRVEEARPVNGGWLPVIHGFATKAEADVHAAESMIGSERCIKVTGPHQQEVPVL